MNAVDDLISVLSSRCGFVPREVSPEGKQLRLLGPMTQRDAWVSVIQQIKRRELRATWTTDISCVYLLTTKNEMATLGKRWRIIIRAKEGSVEDACSDIVAAVQDAPTARTVLDEFPLPGGGAHRMYDTSKGKGATEVRGNAGSGPSSHLFGKR